MKTSTQFPRLASMSDLAQYHDDLTPPRGFDDSDSGLQTEPAATARTPAVPKPQLPTEWPSRPRLPGGHGELSREFLAADKRAPRNEEAVHTFWAAYACGLDLGLSQREAMADADKAAYAAAHQSRVAAVRAAVAA